MFVQEIYGQVEGKLPKKKGWIVKSPQESGKKEAYRFRGGSLVSSYLGVLGF